MNFDFVTIDWKVIIGLIAILVTLFGLIYFQWWRNRKSLSYEVITTALLTAADEIKNDLQILYKGAPIKNAHLVIIKVTNDGYQPIKKDDFEDGLVFEFSEGTQFLSYEIIKPHPSNLKVVLIAPVLHRLGVEPLLLNSKDSFEIRLLVSSNAISVKGNARIVGVKAFKPKESYIANTVLAKLLWPLIGGFAAYTLLTMPVPNLTFRIVTYVSATIIIVSCVIHLGATIHFVLSERRYNRR